MPVAVILYLMINYCAFFASAHTNTSSTPMKKGYLETFWNRIHLEDEEKEDLETRNLWIQEVIT